MKFSKYHALGNDYLVLDPLDAPQMPPPSDVKRICHRNFGLGSDGILYGPIPTERVDFGLQIWNPDGSEAEKSGNGLRIFCRYLYDCDLVEQDAVFKVDTLGGLVSCRVFNNGGEIEVAMGQVSFDAAKIPVNGFDGEVIEQQLPIDGKSYRFCSATIGNPHVVLPMKEISQQLACEIGPIVENMTEYFPNRTNVQLLKVLDRNHIQIEIWERGAGYTLASGSSSSACAAVARRIGACDEDITVHCPRGDIFIKVDVDYQITMRGPVTRVGRFDMDTELLD